MDGQLVQEGRRDVETVLDVVEVAAGLQAAPKRRAGLLYGLQQQRYHTRLSISSRPAMIRTYILKLCIIIVRRGEDAAVPSHTWER